MNNEDYERFTCPVCGKRFTIYCSSDMYGWRFKEDLYCSYTCMRVDEKPYLEDVNQDRSIPEEYKRIWYELLDWKVCNKRYRIIRKVLSVNDKAKKDERLRKEMRIAKRLSEAYLFKYERKLVNLNKIENLLFDRFINKGWSTKRTMQYLNITRAEACDIVIEICKKLKNQGFNDILSRRSSVGVNA